MRTRSPAFGPDDIEVEDDCPEGTSVEFSEEILDSADCAVDGYYLKVLVTWTVKPFCGEVTTISITVNLTDNTPPAILGSDLIEVTCGEDVPEVEVFDACSDVTVTIDETLGDADCTEGTALIIREITAVDACGNEARKTQTVIVNYLDGPIFQWSGRICVQ